MKALTALKQDRVARKCFLSELEIPCPSMSLIVGFAVSDGESNHTSYHMQAYEEREHRAEFQRNENPAGRYYLTVLLHCSYKVDCKCLLQSVLSGSVILH